MTATALLEEVQMTGINSDAPVKGGVRGKAHRLRKDARAAAERFLVRQSYNILEREWNCSGGSVDLVAQDGDLSSNPLRYQQSAESGTASQRAWYPG